MALKFYGENEFQHASATTGMAKQYRFPRARSSLALRGLVDRRSVRLRVRHHGGRQAVGIVAPHDDPAMSRAFVIATDRLRIPAPTFSVGSPYRYCASRRPFGAALDGQTPRAFPRRTRDGAPAYSVPAVLAAAELSFLLSCTMVAASLLLWLALETLGRTRGARSSVRTSQPQAR